jgi:hypothetical protein
MSEAIPVLRERLRPDNAGPLSFATDPARSDAQPTVCDANYSTIAWDTGREAGGEPYGQ